ncbi:MAG: agmatinase [Thermoanaerobaculales bacterium]|nr:agmatinase [Thermoanaerobaculales bacterium]
MSVDDPLKRFFELSDEFADPETARAAILPVPYDRTSTWKKGADRAPQAILEASHHIELFDVVTGVEPCKWGIATLDPIVCDGPPEELADLVDDRVGGLIEAGKLPATLGGDHSISIGAIRAAARLVEGVTVLQLDAHTDTREEYAGSSFNHACTMNWARKWCPIVQVGIRAVDGPEMPLLDQERIFYAHQICGPNEPVDWTGRVVDLLGEKVYVTIDVDCFDPSAVPATGTPEPGGLDWYQVDALLEQVANRREVVGFDIVELLPTPGQWASDFLAAKLMYRFLGRIFSAHQPST